MRAVAGAGLGFGRGKGGKGLALAPEIEPLYKTNVTIFDFTIPNQNEVLTLPLTFVDFIVYQSANAIFIWT